MLDSLYAYNDWANARIFELANGLTAEQLDAPRKMGFGTLRATLFHIWAAERLWLERWRNHPGPSYPGGEATCSLAGIADGLREVARSRRKLLDAERAEGWSRTVIYRDLRNQEHRQRLDDLLLHVANHGIHHRAQALNFLKHLGRKVSGGIDYLFFRIAYPSTPLMAEFIEPLRQSGLEVATGEGTPVEFNQRLLQRYYRYHDWAIDQLMALIQQLAPEGLHRWSDIGLGSIHKTIAHLRNAEDWWMGIWSGSASSFARYDQAESLEKSKGSGLNGTVEIKGVRPL